MPNKIIEELKGLEIIIEDGSLKGCKVYHESIVSFIEQATQSAKKDTAREIGLLTSKAGLSVINLDKQEDWDNAVKKIRQSAKKEAVEECIKKIDDYGLDTVDRVIELLKNY